MSNLINEIRHAQVLAGEAVVIAHLRKSGLVNTEPPKNSKVICLQERVKALEDALRGIATAWNDGSDVDVLIDRAAELLGKK